MSIKAFETAHCPSGHNMDIERTSLSRSFTPYSISVGSVLSWPYYFCQLVFIAWAESISQNTITSIHSFVWRL
jgi:hypothetical protein